MSETKRRLDVAIVGPPNAGKSQLLNSIISTQVAAVSRKRHTTREDILATRTKNNSQLVFIDTPGFMNLKTAKDEKLFKDLVQNARAGITHADYTLVVVDAARKITPDLKESLAHLFLQAIQSTGRIDDETVDVRGNVQEVKATSSMSKEHEKFCIVLNKVDLVSPKEKLLDIAEELGTLGDNCVKYKLEVFTGDAKFEQEKLETATDEERERWDLESPPVFYISAKDNEGVDELASYLHNLSTPTAEFALPPEHVTSMSLAERIEEIIREKLYRCLHKEVPHNIRQVNRFLRKGMTRDGKMVLRVDQELVVRTKSHLKLVLGRNRMTLQRIKQTAKRDLIKNLRVDGIDDVLLNIHVKLNKTQGHVRELESERYGVMQWSSNSN